MDLSLEEFADRLSEIFPVFMKEFLKYQISEVYRGKITPVQFVALNFLDKQGESKMTDIAQSMDVTMATMTGVIERLVRDDYVQRLNDPADRRIVKVRLTTKGHSLIKKIHQTRRKMIIHIFSKIGQKDRGNYLRILTNIKEILLKAKKA